MIVPTMIITTVGDSRRMIDRDLFHDVFDALVELYRDQGLTGARLDHAVRDALPIRLAEVVGDDWKPN